MFFKPPMSKTYKARGALLKTRTFDPGVLTPTFSWDFTKQGLPPAMTGTRASNAYFWQNLSLATATTNALRLDSAQITGISRGLLVEGARTNSFSNTNFSGAVAGVVGAGGSMPTGLVVEGTSGLTTTVVGTGTENGLRYLELNLSGTPTSAQHQFRTGTLVSASIGDVYTASAFAKNIAGFNSVNSLHVGIVEASGGFPATIAPLNGATGSPARAEATRTLTLGGAQQLRFRVGLTVGSPVNYTFRLYHPQFELGAFASSPIITTGSPATRAADAATFIDLGILPYIQPNGTIYCEFEVMNANSAIRGVYSVDDNSSNNYTDLVNSSATALQGRTREGGTTNSSLTVTGLAANTVYKTALAYRLNDCQIAINGVLSGVDTSSSPPASGTRWRLGRTIATSNSEMFCWIRKIMYFPTRLSADQLTLITR